MRLWAAQRASRAQLMLLGWLLQYKHNQGAHCLADRAGYRHCLTTQNVSVSHQPQYILSRLISNILGKVSAERITLSSHLALSLPP